MTKEEELEKEVSRLTLEREEIVNSWDKEVEGLKKKLAKAKEHLRNTLEVIQSEGWDYSFDWIDEAEQFLEEIEE